jgi:DNA-binding MarR family transcriptional regulator
MARPGRSQRTTAQESLRELIRVGGLLRRLSAPHFARVDLTAAQWGVLRSLLRLEQQGKADPRMHELGAAMLVQPPSLSATLQRMEQAGLVARRADDADRRTRRVTLAARGRRLLHHASQDHRRWMERIMGGLKPGEQADLMLLLTRLGHHMRGLVESTPSLKPAAPRPPRRQRRRRAS